MPKTIKKSAICEKCKVRQNIKNVYYFLQLMHYVEIVFVEGGVSVWGQILGSRVTFAANIYTPLDRGMVLLQLCRWTFSTKKLCSRVYSI